MSIHEPFEEESVNYERRELLIYLGTIAAKVIGAVVIIGAVYFGLSSLRAEPELEQEALAAHEQVPDTCSELDAAIEDPSLSSYSVEAAIYLVEQGYVETEQVMDGVPFFFWIFNGDSRELEYWMVLDGTRYQLELVCFEETQYGGMPVFGEVKVDGGAGADA